MCGRPKLSNRNSKPILDREFQILKYYIGGLDTFDTTKTKWLRSIEFLFLSGLRVSEVLNLKIKDIKNGILKGPFIILCQLGKIKNTKGHKDENRNRCRAIC